MNWFGLGKQRSKLGKWLDRRGIKQEDLARMSGVSHTTISRLCSSNAYKPNMTSANKIIKTLRKFDTEISAEDFWGD